MKQFVKFMVNSSGRALRIIAGLILIGVGLWASEEKNWILIVIGMIPLAAGVFDFCLLAPLFGYFFSGKKTRDSVNMN